MTSVAESGAWPGRLVRAGILWGMANTFQITIDAASPRALGEFWCAVLGYVEQPPPEGFDNWEDALDAFGIDRSDPDGAFAIVDPEAIGPRVFFHEGTGDEVGQEPCPPGRSRRIRPDA